MAKNLGEIPQNSGRNKFAWSNFNLLENPHLTSKMDVC